MAETPTLMTIKAKAVRTAGDVMCRAPAPSPSGDALRDRFTGLPDFVLRKRVRTFVFRSRNATNWEANCVPSQLSQTGGRKAGGECTTWRGFVKRSRLWAWAPC